MEPLQSHETHRKTKWDAKAPLVRHTSPQQWVALGLVFVGLMATSFWTYQQWLARDTVIASLKRDPQWSIETPAHSYARAFVRIQDTSFWTPRAYGLLTSSNHISTQAAPVELTSANSAAKIVLAPHTVAHIDHADVTVLGGFALVTGPVRARLPKGDRFITAQETVLIAANQEASDTAHGPSTTVSASLEPRVGSIHDLQTSGRVTLSWPKSLASTNATLEFARDPSFKTVLFTHPASGTPSATVDFADRSPGPWFARLREGGISVAFTSFSLVESETPDQLRRLGRRWFAWRDRGLASIYRVEFSENETFQSISQNFLVRNRELDLTQVKPGRYFARVTAVTSGDVEHVSRPIALQVQEKSEILRAGLELNDPDLKLFARGWKIHLTHDETSRIREGYVILRESELRGVKVSNEVLKSMTLPDGRTQQNVVFELSRDEMFSNPERVRPDSRGELLPPALPLGVLYARLRRVENDGTLGAFGPASRLTTWLPAPLPRKIKTTMVQDVSGVELAWDLKTNVAGYELRVSSSRAFEAEKTHVIRTRLPNRKIATTTVREFFWTVTAINELGLPISLTSPVQEAKVPEEKKAKIPIAVKAKPAGDRTPAMIHPLVPVLQYPAEDAVIVGGATATKYDKLKWSFPNDKGSSTYFIEIATDGDFVNVIERAKTKSLEFQLQGDLPEGALFWRVRRAKTDKNASNEWSRSRRFELVYE